MNLPPRGSTIHRHRHEQHTGTREGLTRVDVLIVLAIVAMSAVVLTVSSARNRELSRQEVCRKNLSDIGIALEGYSQPPYQMYPIAAHPNAVDDRVGQVEYTQAIGSYRGRADDPKAGDTALMSPLPTKLSTTRSLWILHRYGWITRERFVCPSTQDRPNDEPQANKYWDFGVGDITGPATPEQSRQGYRQISYGYQVPYGKHAKPSSLLDHNFMVADKGPYGAAIEMGEPAPPPFSLLPGSSSNQWRPWNSPNHGGPGRGEVQFCYSSSAGVEGWHAPFSGSILDDNLYTRQSGDWSRLEDRYWGDPPAPGARYTPCSNPKDTMFPYDGDVLVYP